MSRSHRRAELTDDLRLLLLIVDVVWDAGEDGTHFAAIAAELAARGRPGLLARPDVLLAVEKLTYVAPVYAVEVPNPHPRGRRLIEGAALDRLLCPTRGELDGWLRRYGWPIDAWRAETLDAAATLPDRRRT